MNFRMSLLNVLSLVVLLLLGSVGCPGNSPPPTEIPPPPPIAPPPLLPGLSLLQVSHHNLLVFDDPGADSILTAASTVAQTNNGLGDAPCPVTLTRNGSITTFGSPSFINSQADLNAVLALPGQVKVVNQINWCGGLSPNIIGCAPVPGTSLVVVRFLPVSEGILWLHEYGHNKGLNHRDDPTAVMHPTLDQSRTMITAEECAKYMATPVAAAQAGVMESRFDMAQGQGGTGQLMPVESFVRQTFVHGVPYATASQYGPDTVPKLLAMLNDPAEKDYWANIVITLGMIGDARAVDALIAFVEKGGDSRSQPGALPSEDQRADGDGISHQQEWEPESHRVSQELYRAEWRGGDVHAWEGCVSTHAGRTGYTIKHHGYSGLGALGASDRQGGLTVSTTPGRD